MLCMTYYGAEKVIPHYNVMGVAKSALEASTRYLAYDFGPQGVRVNAISAGPIRTLAAAGVSGFKEMYRQFAGMAPLRENVTTEDVGNVAVFLCSDMAARITGEVLYVDSGYNIVGVPEPPHPMLLRETRLRGSHRERETTENDKIGRGLDRVLSFRLKHKDSN
jgi:enoyl-[acyl-carrier protein] reductase I